MATIVVAGGGAAGLAAAFEIARNHSDHEVRLIEQEHRVGGKIRSASEGGFLLEEGPESLLTRKPAGIALCRELGIADRLIGRTPRAQRSFIFRGGRLHPLPEGFSGLVPSDPAALETTTLLSAEGKRRAQREPEVPPRPADAPEESVAAFMRRRFGREAFESMIEPLASGIFAGDTERMSVQAAFPALVARERRQSGIGGGHVAPGNGEIEPTGRDAGSRPAGAGTAAGPAAAKEASRPDEKGGALPPFVSFRSGIEELSRALEGAIGPGRLLIGSGAARIKRASAGYSVELADGAVIQADALVLATPAFVTARLVEPLSPALAEAHAAIPAASTVVVNLGYRLSDLPGDLDGYGYLTPRVEDRYFHGCTWSSSKWPGRAPEGHALLRLYGGRFGAEELFRMDDDEVEAAATAELAETLHIEARPLLVRITRLPRAIPQYNLGHRAILASIEEALEELPALALAGASYSGVGLPDCIRSGREAARRAVEYLAGR